MKTILSRQWGVVLGAVLLSTLGIAVACGDPKAGVAADLDPSRQPDPAKCGTPQMGCPCDTPGTKVACGKHISGAVDFVYCYEGSRECLPTGVYGDCTEGSIVPKAMSMIRPTALATTSTACSGGDPGPVTACSSGRQEGEPCTSNLDCTNGVRKCYGGSDSTQSCRRNNHCDVACGHFNGTCSGGTSPNIGCDSNADCAGGGTCTASGGGGVCGTFTGICDSTDANFDGEACNSNLDCGAVGTCEFGKKGHCLGGKNNGEKCKKNKHCYGVSVCSTEVEAGSGALDPCDPYCVVWSDTPVGFDAGAGFTVVDGGLVPTFACGNGIQTPSEQCDDGNFASGDGCDGTCKLEPGYSCPTPGSPCVPATCGNGVKEGLEQCDDGNNRPYDGCSPTCTLEVSCPAAGPCVAVCGDGIKFPSEQCDDGNLTDGDGCSSTCTIESGATCTTITAPSPASIDVPVIYRDFDPNTHSDFQKFSGTIPHNVPPVFPYTLGFNCPGGTVQGIPSINLGADKEPVLNATQNCVKDAASFFQWYHDDATVNQVILGRSLRLFKVGASYVFDSATDTVTAANINCGSGGAAHCNNLTGFWPLNGLGYGNYAATGKNFHFTSEVRYPFTYAGGETLSFSGDDDVWVFVNGIKVVDLGGVHPATAGAVTLNAATASVPGGTPVNLVVGNTYEIDVFQAERNTTGSNYKLTLQGFNRTTSQCSVTLPPTIVVRDFQGTCAPGSKLVWQLFRWKAAMTAGSSIAYRAATADTQAALPASETDPSTVAIGTATAVNSPDVPNPSWTYDPQPVSAKLAAAVPTQTSKSWLRVYMTFTGAPTLYEWQQLYDCIPAE